MTDYLARAQELVEEFGDHVVERGKASPYQLSPHLVIGVWMRSRITLFRMTDKLRGERVISLECFAKLLEARDKRVNRNLRNKLIRHAARHAQSPLRL